MDSAQLGLKLAGLFVLAVAESFDLPLYLFGALLEFTGVGLAFAEFSSFEVFTKPADRVSIFSFD